MAVQSARGPPSNPLPNLGLVSLAPSGGPPGQQLNKRSGDSVDSLGFLPNARHPPRELARLATDTCPGTRGVASPHWPRQEVGRRAKVRSGQEASWPELQRAARGQWMTGPPMAAEQRLEENHGMNGRGALEGGRASPTSVLVTKGQ